MKAYKLFRELKNGELTSLFINKTERLELNKWMVAESYPTKGFKLRPYWHCTSKPEAPHLSNKNRVWMEVVMDGYTEFKRPEIQGGVWFLADNIKIIGCAQNV
jgi:hypothetical protein